MPYTLPPITLTEGATSAVNIPGSLGSVTYLKMVNASPYLLAINNLLGGSDYMQPGEANVWPVPGLSTAVQVTPQQFGINPAIIPSTVLVVTWYLEGEQPNGNYPVNFNTLSYVGNSIVSNSPANVFEQDLFTPFVLTGYDATKDGSIANQLDVAAGVAFLQQSSDNSRLRIANNATSFLTTTPSTTYFLDLNPDGSWSFATTHSGVALHLTIAQATTDASGNIATVTDERPLLTTLLGALVGRVNLPLWASDSGQIFDDGAGGLTAQKLLVSGGPSGSSASAHYEGSFLIFRVGETGATAQGFDFQTWNGSAAVIPFGIGAGAAAFASTYLADTGAFAQINAQATVGSFGVPVIVAQALAVAVTATTLQTIVTFTPSSTGMYRASMYINNRNPTSTAVNANVGWIDPTDSTNPAGVFSIQNSGGVVSPVLLSGTNTVSAGHYATYPLTFYAKAGGAIRVSYQNPSGTPNDVVSAIIERLA